MEPRDRENESSANLLPDIVRNCNIDSPQKRGSHYLTLKTQIVSMCIRWRCPKNQSQQLQNHRYSPTICWQQYQRSRRFVTYLRYTHQVPHDLLLSRPVEPSRCQSCNAKDAQWNNSIGSWPFSFGLCHFRPNPSWPHSWGLIFASCCWSQHRNSEVGHSRKPKKHLI